MPDGNVPPVAPGLDALLAPRSVAIVGALADPARIGGRPLAYYLAAGFEGPIYPVNPTRTEVQGLPAYASLCDVAAEIDFALLAIPAEAVPDTLDACAATGVKAAVIFSAGFAERDAGGAARQREIIARARRRHPHPRPELSRALQRGHRPLPHLLELPAGRPTAARARRADYAIGRLRHASAQHGARAADRRAPLGLDRQRGRCVTRRDPRPHDRRSRHRRDRLLHGDRP